MEVSIGQKFSSAFENGEVAYGAVMKPVEKGGVTGITWLPSAIKAESTEGLCVQLSMELSCLG